MRSARSRIVRRGARSRTHAWRRAIAGCAQKLPDAAPGITGTVTSLQPGDGRPASVLVEGGQQPPGAVSDKAQVTIAPGTTFFDAEWPAHRRRRHQRRDAG